MSLIREESDFALKMLGMMLAQLSSLSKSIVAIHQEHGTMLQEEAAALDQALTQEMELATADLHAQLAGAEELFQSIAGGETQLASTKELLQKQIAAAEQSTQQAQAAPRAALASQKTIMATLHEEGLLSIVKILHLNVGEIIEMLVQAFQTVKGPEVHLLRKKPTHFVLTQKQNIRGIDWEAGTTIVEQKKAQTILTIITVAHLVAKVNWPAESSLVINEAGELVEVGVAFEVTIGERAFPAKSDFIFEAEELVRYGRTLADEEEIHGRLIPAKSIIWYNLDDSIDSIVLGADLPDSEYEQSQVITIEEDGTVAPQKT